MVEVTLNKPISVNGSNLSVLSLDFEALSTADLKSAQRIRALISDSQSIDANKIMSVLRLDSDFQISVGFLAAIKGTEGLTQMDFLKLSMKDALLVGEAAYDYFFD